MATILGYGLCQSACNAGWVTCYGLAGLTAGTVSGGAAAPAAAVGCNAIQATCMTSCATATLVTTATEVAVISSTAAAPMIAFAGPIALLGVAGVGVMKYFS